MTAALETHGITVRFGGNVALNDVSVDAHPGMVTGLIGPNGAGKTTLFNVDHRAAAADQRHGHARRQGHQQAPRRTSGPGAAWPARSSASSCSRRSPCARTSRSPARSATGGARSPHERRGRGRPDHRAGRPRRRRRRDVSDIPTGTARVVELGRALMTQPKVLLLDEPASGQTEQETERFGAAAPAAGARRRPRRAARRARHVARHGRVRRHPRARLRPHHRPRHADEIRSDQAVLDAYLGADRSTHDRSSTPRHSQARPRRCSSSSTSTPATAIEVLHGVDLVVPEGNVVALLGPNGGGKSTTLKVVRGPAAATAGEVRIGGRAVNGGRPTSWPAAACASSRKAGASSRT